MTEEAIVLTREDNFAILTINRPERKNALSYAMLARMAEIVRELKKDSSVRALLVTGAGDTFSSGTDLRELSGRTFAKDGGTETAAASRDPMKQGELTAPWLFHNLPQPVIALINGAAVGLGAELTLQADIRLASTKARLSWIFGKRGLIPDTGAGTWLLPRLVGISKAFEITMTSKMLSAEQALNLGLVSEVVEPDRLLEKGRALAGEIASCSPMSVGLIKQLTYKGLERDALTHTAENAKLLNKVFTSKDFAEGVKAFLEKRDPIFTGE